MNLTQTSPKCSLVPAALVERSSCFHQCIDYAFLLLLMYFKTVMMGVLDTNPEKARSEAAGKEEASPQSTLRFAGFLQQPTIYPHRTALKAWGNDNSFDFGIFDVGFLGEQQSCGDCVQLERRNCAFPF